MFVFMKLFLDDIRQVRDACYYVSEPRVYWEEGWDVVRSYEEFVSYIEVNGLPELVSFDHDLADEHYVPKEYWGDYEGSREYQEQQEYKEKTGLDCARWLVDYCMDNKLRLPEVLVHSANPVGRDNIVGFINNAKKELGL